MTVLRTPVALERHESEGSFDGGFTLVELLVAVTLFGLLATLLLSVSLSTAAVTDDVSERAALTGEARLAVERMGRELRQAKEVTAAEISSENVSITFWTDFDGDDQVDYGLSDPEVLTYRWTRSSERLTLTADDAAGTSVTRPVLAAHVTQLDLQLRSSLWQYDGRDGTERDGTTTWRELDHAGAPVGNGNNLPDLELQHVDLVAMRVVVTDGSVPREFLMQADLRNQVQP